MWLCVCVCVYVRARVRVRERERASHLRVCVVLERIYHYDFNPAQFCHVVLVRSKGSSLYVPCL